MLVETSYLMAGLLTTRQYFNGADVAETNLRNDINETIYNLIDKKILKIKVNVSKVIEHILNDMG